METTQQEPQTPVFGPYTGRLVDVEKFTTPREQAIAGACTLMGLLADDLKENPAEYLLTYTECLVSLPPLTRVDRKVVADVCLSLGTRLFKDSPSALQVLAFAFRSWVKAANA